MEHNLLTYITYFERPVCLLKSAIEKGLIERLFKGYAMHKHKIFLNSLVLKFSMKKKNQCFILLVWHTQAKKQTNTHTTTYIFTQT